MDATLGILVLVAIIYLLVIIGVIIFIINKKRGNFKQTIDPKPQNPDQKESDDQ